MPKTSVLVTLCTYAALLSGILAAPSSASPVADFYKGRTITILVPFGAGGGYGLYARMLGRHIPRHIPGNPDIHLQFMPGAGGGKASVYFYNVANRDGTYMALLSNAVAIAQATYGKRLMYDASKFTYIGRIASMRSAIIVWSSTGVTSLADAREKTVIFGSTGKSSQDYMNPMLMKNLLGFRVKIVTGYQGSRAINAAMEKGEVHAMANSWGSVKARLGQWLDRKLITPIAMVGLTPAPDRPDIPTLISLAKNEDDRAVLEFVASSTAVGRSFALPPGVPAERVAALRRAFRETLEDPLFLADARKRNMDLDYMPGGEVEKIVRRTVAVSPALIERLKAAVGTD